MRLAMAHDSHDLEMLFDVGSSRYFRVFSLPAGERGGGVTQGPRSLHVTTAPNWNPRLIRSNRGIMFGVALGIFVAGACLRARGIESAP